MKLRFYKLEESQGGQTMRENLYKHNKAICYRAQFRVVNNCHEGPVIISRKSEDDKDWNLGQLVYIDPKLEGV